MVAQYRCRYILWPSFHFYSFSTICNTFAMEKDEKVQGRLRKSRCISDQQTQEPQFACNDSETDTSSPPSETDVASEDNIPFGALAAILQDVTKDGGIKKRILYEGYGPALQDKAVVSIYYEAYLEHTDEPFDATFCKTYTFCLGENATNATLSLAVRSMKLGEESQFLIQPIYVFGMRGFLKPPPPNRVILLEITVKNVSASSPPTSPVDRNQEFYDVYKYAHALSSQAKDLCDKLLYTQAITEYNDAVYRLEQVETKNQVEKQKQQQLLLRLLTNLVTLHTKLEKPRIAFISIHKIYNLCKAASLQVPVKVLFNQARCLILVSNFKDAKKRLQEAQKLEPKNEAISKELVKLEARRKEVYNKAMVVRKAANVEMSRLHQPEVSNKFKKSIADYCEDLLNDSFNLQYKLPDKLTQKELDFSEKEVQKYGFEFKRSKLNGVVNYFIIKTVDGTKC